MAHRDVSGLAGAPREHAGLRSTTGHAAVSRSARRRRLSSFWRHFLEMLAAMFVGMVVTGGVFLSIVGVKTWDEVTVQYPTQSLIAMAVGMTVPMVGWMLYRGMGLRSSAEMAGAMVVPVIPFLCLVWFGVTKSAQCGAYCAVMVLSMLILMRVQRTQHSSYGTHAMSGT
jgi:hypothetical protein